MAKFRTNANPEWEKAMHEKGRSNATQPHEDRRTKRARSRADAKRRAIDVDYS